MRSGVLMVLVLLLLAGGALAQPYVVYDGNSDELCFDYEAIYSTGSRHYIAIANPDAVQTDVKIVLWARAIAENSPLTIRFVRFSNGFDTLFDAAPTVNLNTVTGGVEIAIEAHATTSPGLPVSSDTIRYIEITVDLDVGHFINETFCFDSTSSTTLGNWQFSPGPTPTWEPNPDFPGQGSLVCFAVQEYVGVYPAQTDCASVGGFLGSGRFCDEMSLIWSGSSVHSNASFIFAIFEGPGTIDSFTGYWSWTPSAADADKDTTLEVGVLWKLCDPDWLGPWDSPGAPCIVTLHPGPNSPPTFVNSHEMDVTVSGQPLSMLCAVNDDDPCTDYTYTYFVPPGEPTPPIQCDPTTGEITYPANPGDTDTYNFALVVTEGQHADTTDVTLYHWDSPLCGDMNHDGSSDITDLTWIIGFAFKGGVSPSPPEAGNINCLAGVDISDITYLVKFMFASGPDPCDCE